MALRFLFAGVLRTVPHGIHADRPIPHALFAIGLLLTASLPPSTAEAQPNTGPGFTLSDLHGYWVGVAFTDSTDFSNDPNLSEFGFGLDAEGHFGGYFPIDEQGFPYGDEYGGWFLETDNTTSQFIVDTIESGSVEIGGTGAVSGTFNLANNDEAHSFSNFQLNKSRDLLGGVLHTPDMVGLVAIAKVDPEYNYTLADLEGRWAAFQFSDNILRNDPRAGSGDFEIDATGAVTGGGKQGPQGLQPWPTGLHFAIDNYGRITETSGGIGGEPLLQLAEGRQLAVGTTIGFRPGGEDEHRIFFLVKRTTGVAGSDLAGDFRIFGFEDEDDQQANNPAILHGGVRFDPTGSQLLDGTIYSSDGTMEPELVDPHVVDVQPDGEVTLEPSDSIVAWAWGLEFDCGCVPQSPPTGTGYTAIVAAGDHIFFALRSDGSIAAWGYDLEGSVSNAPTGAAEFKAIAAAGGVFLSNNYEVLTYRNNLALRDDGSIEAWGSTGFGTISEAPTGTGYTAIAAGAFHSLALRPDGSIEAWGNDSAGNVSNTPTGTGYTAIATGKDHSLALRDDGSIEAWGNDSAGNVSNTPTGTDYTAIAAGAAHSLALRGDGSIKAWGYNLEGSVSNTPTGTGYTAIAAGAAHSLALRDDGSIEAWGQTVPGSQSGEWASHPLGTEYTAIAAGQDYNLALRADDSPTTFQFSPEAGVMIGADTREFDSPLIILAFAPEPGATLLGGSVLGILGRLRRRRQSLQDPSHSP